MQREYQCRYSERIRQLKLEIRRLKLLKQADQLKEEKEKGSSGGKRSRQTVNT